MAKKRNYCITSNLSLNGAKPFGKLTFHKGSFIDFIYLISLLIDFK